jgi:hypothetical protein
MMGDMVMTEKTIRIGVDVGGQLPPTNSHDVYAMTTDDRQARTPMQWRLT